MAAIDGEDIDVSAVRHRYGIRLLRIASRTLFYGVMESLTDNEQNLFSYLAGITTSETLSLYNQDLIAVFDSEARIPHANLFPIHTSS